MAAFAQLSARAQPQDTTTILPDEGPATLVGCLQFKEGHHDDYVLMNPTVGPATSVPEATCVAAGMTVGLEGKATHQLDQSMVGRWVEISGKLEGREGHREVHLTSFRLVPVVIPRAAEAAPPPEIEQPAAPQAEALAPPPQPTATTGIVEEQKLPKTASPLPLTGSIGLLSIAGALALRMFGRRRVEG
jgi:hypothetical protein